VADTPSVTANSAKVTYLTVTESIDLDKVNDIVNTDYQDVASLGHTGHTPINTAQPDTNALLVVRGGNSVGDNPAPDSDVMYAKTCGYFEMHTDANITTEQSIWGNAAKIGTIVAECQAHAGAQMEANGGVFRAYSTDGATKTNTPLVGMSCIGQTNCETGNNWDVFGANIIAAETDGNPAPNCVGIEVDVLHNYDATTADTNYTAYWAQADGGGVFSGTAFLATRSSQSTGWQHILRSDCECNNAMINIRNSKNVNTAHGIIVDTTYGGVDGRILDCKVGGVSSFYVNGNNTNPIWVKVGGTLKQVIEGAADSGGTDYKQLIVVN